MQVNGGVEKKWMNRIEKKYSCPQVKSFANTKLGTQTTCLASACASFLSILIISFFAFGGLSLCDWQRNPKISSLVTASKPERSVSSLKGWRTQSIHLNLGARATPDGYYEPVLPLCHTLHTHQNNIAIVNFVLCFCTKHDLVKLADLDPEYLLLFS